MRKAYFLDSYESKRNGHLKSDRAEESLRHDLLVLYHSLSNVVRNGQLICVNVSSKAYRHQAYSFLESKRVPPRARNLLVWTVSKEIFGEERKSFEDIKLRDTEPERSLF